jgi:nucleoside-diphosphate-sugar epimerase
VSGLEGSVGVLTGASGFIGRAILRSLPAGVTVYATYNTSDRFRSWAAELQADVRPVQIDLARNRLAPAVGSEVDWALSLAARVATHASRENPVEELAQVAGPAVNAIAGLRARRLVHVSSGSVYETLEGRLSPSLCLSPRLPYAIGKLAGEHLVGSYSETEPWIVRFFGAYGPGEPGFKVTARMVRAFQRGATTFDLSGDGTNRIDPMHIDDAVASLVTLCASNQAPHTIDLCQGESLAMSDYAALVYEASHPDAAKPPLRLGFGGVANEEMRGVPDPAAADAVIGHRRRTLRQGMKEYAGWVLAQTAKS